MKFLKKMSVLCVVSYAVFLVATTYIAYVGKPIHAVLAAGVALVLYGLTEDVSVGLLAGAAVGLVAHFYSLGYKEGFEEEEEEGAKTKANAKAKTKPLAKKEKAPPPDNGSRAEFFELGKKYKAPSEEDDAEFHLDAGTTFMNAYKSLKPDQVAAMTKDTQDLMATQKQLMSTLHTLKPLIKDGKDMMEMFQSYFGAGMPSS